MRLIIALDGLRADPGKLKAINQMPPPTDKPTCPQSNRHDKLRAEGCCKPNRFGQTTKRACQEGQRVSDKEVHGQCLDQVKQVLTQLPVLKFFDPQNKTVLQCDASMSGLGAC